MYFLNKIIFGNSKMEADKENVVRTKIPLPLEPLPAIPKRLLKDSKTANNEKVVQRCPLKTLNSQTLAKAGPSQTKALKAKPKLRLDTKYVTLRQKCENLDWCYKVFQDKEDDDASIISISDDEVDEKKQNFVEDKRKNNLGETSNAVTPYLKACLEPNRIRNIKKSLKRPHSRELQGLSPMVHDGKVDDKVKRRLKFNERLDEKSDKLDYWNISYLRCLNRDYTSDVFSYLLAVETKPLAIPRTSGVTRACVINWLMKVNGIEGNPATIQSACWYLDSILGTGHVQLDKLQLVAAACYWLAQKLNGPPAPALRLVKCADRAFNTDSLLAAEKAVLHRLQFPRQPVVPQDYISYFSWWCDNSNPGEIETAATFLCMSGMMVDKVLCDEYPSVIAAAAVRNALLLLRNKDLMMYLQECPVYRAASEKGVNLSYTCSILRRAVRTVAAPNYEYKAPLEHYGVSPQFIAQRIVSAANELSLVDVRNTDRTNLSYRY